MIRWPEFDRAILGINYSGYHDSSIALVSLDGEILYACSLERITRVKQDARPPHRLLEGLPWDRIEAVAVSAPERLPDVGNATSRFHPLPLKEPLGRWVHAEQFYEYFESLPAPKVYFDHQFCHAASAWYLAGGGDAVCFCYDGGMANSPWFGGIYTARPGSGIESCDLFASSHYAKITRLYSAVTALAGFSPNKHEGKITGLAAYGQPTERCREALMYLFEERNAKMERLMGSVGLYSEDQPPLFYVNDAVREEINAELGDIPREEMAATVQAIAEEHVLTILNRAVAAGAQAPLLCLAGGLFANVKINQRSREAGFPKVFVAPPMTDDGTALGAALALAARGSGFRSKPVRHMFWGPRFSENEIEQTLADRRVRYGRVTDPASAVARELACGKTVAVFQGAMEFGPRALGNRSILAPAGDAAINQTLNAQLCRTEFMPFAPMTREEEAGAAFPGIAGAEHTAQFMTITSDCSASIRERCPAVVHIDGTARPQIVRAETHPFIHRVLTEYRKETGNDALINTSFNVHEEPIVCSPDDAIDGFLGAGIDFLYFEGGFLARFEDNHSAALKFLQRQRGIKRQKERELTRLNQAQSKTLAMLEEACRERLEVIEAQEKENSMLRDICRERLELIETLSNEIARRT